MKYESKNKLMLAVAMPTTPLSSLGLWYIRAPTVPMLTATVGMQGTGTLARELKNTLLCIEFENALLCIEFVWQCFLLFKFESVEFLKRFLKWRQNIAKRHPG